MGARFLDDEARAALKAAVETVERASAAEVVIAVRRRSDRYLHANLIVGTIVAFAGLAYALYADATFPVAAILVDPFVLGFGAAALVELMPHVKRVLAPRTMRDRVEHAAHAVFVERGVHNTSRRGGLLVYVSWLERRVVLVADSALAHAWPDAELVRAEATLAGALGSGVEFARQLAALADPLARAMPHHDGDVNELPDVVDDDMGSAR